MLQVKEKHVLQFLKPLPSKFSYQCQKANRIRSDEGLMLETPALRKNLCTVANFPDQLSKSQWNLGIVVALQPTAILCVLQ